MKANPKIYILILQYNHSEHTLKCLDSLRALTYDNYHVCIIDNGSDPKHASTARLYVTQHPELTQYTYIQNKQNLGYAAGNNVGIKHALENYADYVLVLNNDTLVRPDMLQQLLTDADKLDRPTLLQPVIKEGDRTAYAGGPITWFNATQTTLEEKPEQPFDIDLYAMGAALFIPRPILEQAGLLDEDYFFYYEDADYSNKVRKAGYDVAVADHVTIEHVQGGSSKALTWQGLYYGFRNMLRFTKRWAPWYIRFAIHPWILYTKIKQRIKIILGRDVRQSYVILQALEDYTHGNFGKVDETLQ